MITDHFVREPSEYQRETDHINVYLRDSATYVSRMTGKPFDECLAKIKAIVGPTGVRPFTRPMATVLLRGANGDRKLHRMPFDQFVSDAVEANEVLAPNLTGYMSADIKESIPAQYITANLQLRKKAKHEMLAAQMAGNTQLESIKNAEQTSYKYNNNSLSGAHRSEHTPLYNKSSHSTLTSICRCATSYGNAGNEKFLMGNRHYWSPDVVKANIVSIVNSTDLVRFQAVMDQFGVRAPTCDETYACVERSAKLYWRNPQQSASIRRLIDALSDVERAAFVYSGDLFHLAAYNRGLVQTLFEEMAARPAVGDPDPDTWIKAMDDDLKAYVSLLCTAELAGGTIKDLKEGFIDKDNVHHAANPGAYAMVAATAHGVIRVLDKYADLIKCFWVTDTMPTSISFFPSSLRRTAITSDTDSTIFTVQHWVQWMTGKQNFDEASLAVAYTAVYLTSQTIRHVLAKLSANLGARKKDLFKLQMKNEFFYPVFVLTPRAKHYYAYMSAREGNVYKEMKLDVKGVALRNSKVPVYFNKKVKVLMKSILDTVLQGRSISIISILDDIATMERSIIENVQNGRYDHLTKEQVRTAEAYKNPMSSNYIHYGMWEQVFAPKYGHVEEPPYRSVKVSLNLNSPTQVKEWLAKIKDPGIRERFVTWMESINKTDVTMLLMPEAILSVKGVPEEVVVGLDTRQLVVTIVEAFYVVLESLGVYFKNGNNTRLVSDGTYVLPKPTEP